MINTPNRWTWSDAEIEKICNWAAEAGQIALHYFRNVTPQQKSDKTWLTQADLEVDRFLTAQLRTAYPDDGLISEEGVRVEKQQVSDNIWVIDPLDGTTAFVLGLPGWGISIGLLHQGQPYFGLFYMPLTNDLTYIAAPGQVCDNSGRHLTYAARQTWGVNGFLAVNASAHYNYRTHTYPVRALGSVGANLIYTARGVAAAAFLTKARLWDLVAGAAILQTAGGELRYLSGQKVEYGQLFDGALAPEPIIAGRPELLAGLQKSIGGKHTSQQLQAP